MYGIEGTDYKLEDNQLVSSHFMAIKTFSAPHEGFCPDYANLQNETKQRVDALLQKILSEVQKQLDNYMKK